MTASARKTAPDRRIPSYCKIASYRSGAPVALLSPLSTMSFGLP